MKTRKTEVNFFVERHDRTYHRDGGHILDHTLELVGTLLFAVAVLHTFLVGKIQRLSHAAVKGSVAEGVLHFLGEVEAVFGLWATVFLLFFALSHGWSGMTEYMDQLHFVEPVFVFCLMVVASTQPVLAAAGSAIRVLSRGISKGTGLSQVHVDLFTLLTVGSLAGSFITEPAAMTVTAMILLAMENGASRPLLYALLATLFVNVSIGGAMTPFAAPPVLMVAQKWNWDFEFMLTHFAFKVVIACIINSLALTLMFRQEIGVKLKPLDQALRERPIIPGGVIAVHLFFLLLLVLAAHHPNLLVGIFLFFLGVVAVFQKHHIRLRLRESLMVAFFLGGLMVFGEFQAWWLSPVLASLGDGALYLGATALTAVTDNAALTYLGSQVQGLSDTSKYFLVAGALAGGGLTIIANAPNVAGFSILQPRLGGELHAGLLFKAALIPTLVAVLCLGLL